MNEKTCVFNLCMFVGKQGYLEMPVSEYIHLQCQNPEDELLVRKCIHLRTISAFQLAAGLIFREQDDTRLLYRVAVNELRKEGW